MSLMNPYAFTVTGDPMPVATPPALRVHGGLATAAQISAAQAVFANFCMHSRLSSVPNPTQQGMIEAGVNYRIVTLGGTPIMELFISAAPEEEDNSKLYVDTGWLIDNQPEMGWPTKAQEGRFSVKATAGSDSTWLGLRALLKEYFEDTFTGNYRLSGQSFGNGISYSGLFGEELARQMQTDADKIREKKKALPLIGLSSGLLRCLVKGRIGRRLRDKSVISLSNSGGQITGSVDGMQISPQGGGILIGSQGFTYVKLGSASCQMTPLEIPKKLAPVWEVLRTSAGSSSVSATRKIMLATYLLAYAKASTSAPPYSVEYGDDVKDPFVGGWRFSLFSNKCVGVSVEVPDDWTALFTGTEILFTEQDDGYGNLRFSVEVKDHGTERFYPTGSPIMWFMDMAAGELLRFVLKPTVPPPTGGPGPIVNAFYTQDDELTLVRPTCSEYKTEGWTVDKITKTTACGQGESVNSTLSSFGIKFTSKIRLDGGIEFTDARRSTQSEREDFRNYKMAGITLRTDSNLGGWGGGGIPSPGTNSGDYCSVNTLGGPLTGFEGVHRGWYGDWTRVSGYKTISGAEVNVVILSGAFTDSQLWVRIRRDQVYSQSSTTGLYGIAGRRLYNYYNQPVFDGFYPVGDTPGTGGGITGAPYELPTEVKTTYPRRAGASAVLGGVGNDEFLTLASEGYDSGGPIEAYLLSGGDGKGLPWAAVCVQSAHMNAWATVCPNYDNEAINNSQSFVIGNLPIGAE